MNENCSTIQVSLKQLSRTLSNDIGKHIWRLDGLLLSNAILMGIVVGVGTYAPRYRQHPVIGMIFMGATILFLPIISKVASTIGSVRFLISSLLGSLISNVTCRQVTHLVIVLVWTGIVVVIGISASPVIAADAREGRNIDPTIVLLVLSGLHTLQSQLYFPQIEK